jgi:nitroreductase
MFDLDQTDLLLSTTRSVRRRLDLERPVERGVVLDCIRLAVQAPTASNSQGWRWLIVDDPTVRTALGELYERMGVLLKAYSREGASAQTNRVLDSAVLLAGLMSRVPMLVVPCIEGRLADTSPITASSFYGSIVPAIWSFQLALRSRGLGSCYTTLHLVLENEARELLGIPEDVTQVALLPVAYTIGPDFKPAVRGPVEDITYANHWGQRV